MKNTIITDWLEKHGDPQIEKRVEYIFFIKEIERIIKEYPNDMKLGKAIRSFVSTYQFTSK